jgi:hypothetical protein
MDLYDGQKIRKPYPYLEYYLQARISYQPKDHISLPGRPGLTHLSLLIIRWLRASPWLRYCNHKRKGFPGLAIG